MRLNLFRTNLAPVWPVVQFSRLTQTSAQNLCWVQGCPTSALVSANFRVRVSGTGATTLAQCPWTQIQIPHPFCLRNGTTPAPLLPYLSPCPFLRVPNAMWWSCTSQRIDGQRKGAWTMPLRQACFLFLYNFSTLHFPISLPKSPPSMLDLSTLFLALSSFS